MISLPLLSSLNNQEKKYATMIPINFECLEQLLLRDLFKHLIIQFFTKFEVAKIAN